MSSSSAAADDYAALMRDDISISDVTSDEGNAEILHDLKDDNPNLTGIYLTGGNADDAYPVFDVYDTRALGVLGFFLGRSANVTELHFLLPPDLNIGIIEPFLLELRNNRSISELNLAESHIPQDFFRMLTPFISNNPSLTSLDVDNCEMGAEQYQLLSLALRESKSLKEYSISSVSVGDRYDHEESIIANIEALQMHPQLEGVQFGRFVLGRNVCAALADLLRQSAVEVQTLNLSNNDIDDAGVEALVEGLAHCRGLRRFQLARNPSITARGWRAVASLLEDPASSLRMINLRDCGIDDESAILFANALAHNNRLEKLYFDFNSEGVTGESWAAFSKVLCDTSSVNRTFLSNHTLHRIDGAAPQDEVPDDIALLLFLNQQSDKKALAIRKILRYHDNFDMQPLFEWDLKVLPLVVGWFERAATYGFKATSIRKRKLAAIFQFTRGLPELTIDSILGGVNTKPGKVGGEKRPHSTAFEEE